MRTPRFGVAAVLAAMALCTGGCELVLGLDAPQLYLVTGGGGTGGTSSMGGTAGTSCMAGETVSCYSGPAGTVGVGICKAGIQTCAADGSGFGPCTGEVTPSPEDCSKPADEDCSGIACGGTLWVDQFTNIQAFALTTDRESGAIFVVGTFSDTAQLGVDHFTSEGNTDLFLVKLDNGGKVEWANQVGGVNGESALAVEYHDHTVTLLAKTAGGLNVEGTAVSAGLVVVRYKDDGAFEWVTPCPGDAFGRLAVDPTTKDVIIAGWFTQIQCGSQPYFSGDGYDIFAARLNGVDGTEAKMQFWSNPGDQEARAVAIDKQGSIYIGGTSPKPFAIGPTTQPAGMYLAKLTGNALPLWFHSFGDGTLLGLSTDEEDNLSLVGDCTGDTNDFGGDPLPLVGAGSDICVGKLGGADGTEIWARRFGVPGSLSSVGGLRPVSADSQGNLALTGLTDGLSIDGQVVATSGFVANLQGSTGKLSWLRGFEFANANVAFSRKDALAVAGRFGPGTSDFGKGPVKTNPGEIDAFVLLITP